ncbi:hypothetical protein EON65_06295 [archaeon]|nr:MAG: hypothetical protein EON65_06295 [archaeon]
MVKSSTAVKLVSLKVVEADVRTVLAVVSSCCLVVPTANGGTGGGVAVGSVGLMVCTLPTLSVARIICQF